MRIKSNTVNILSQPSEIGTPVSNTGLFPQNSQFPVSVDTLTLNLRRVATAKGAKDAIAMIEEFFHEKIEYSLSRPTFMMKQWSGCSIRSLRGTQIHWNAPKEYGYGHLRVHLPGKALSGVSLVDLHDILQVLDGIYALDCSRIDIAVDDKSGDDYLGFVRSAQIHGNYTGFRSHRYITSARIGQKEGQTLYFGSSSSDKQLRVYDKQIESGSSSSWIRWESQLRKAAANDVFSYWLNVRDRTANVLAVTLGGIVSGAIDFIDRRKRQKDLSRCNRFNWWEALRSRMGAAFKPKTERKVNLLQDKIGWICKAVIPSLSAVKAYMGECDFWNFIEETMKEKGPLSSINAAMVSQAIDLDMAAAAARAISRSISPPPPPPPLQLAL